MNIIKESKIYNNWFEVIQDFQNITSENYIFRGQSNSCNRIKRETQPWKLISSFNRKYTRDCFFFSTYIKQQLSDYFFKKIYNDYEYKNIEYLINSSFLERLYFLQHYGVETCLLDFTKNPLIALYFAISNIPFNSGGTYDKNDDLVLYPDDCYASIYAINIKRIIELLDLKELDSKIVQDYRHYRKKYDVYVGYNLSPAKKIKNCEDNFNLHKQESVFILFDNFGSPLDFIEFLKSELCVTNRGIKEDLIHIFRLSYNSINKTSMSDYGNIKLFNYLHKMECTGKYLFNDLQGLKNDFNLLQI